MTTSPRPWTTGGSTGTDGRTLYTPDPNPRGGRLIGVMDTGADAALVAAAVNAYGQPSPIEDDLRCGLQMSEQRRQIAAVVATHHQECLAAHGATVGTDAVIEGFSAVLAALGGSTDPEKLGIDLAVLSGQVRVILASQDGDRDA